MTPRRIQMTRNKPWRPDNPHAVRVDRSTKWGNPFKVGENIPRDDPRFVYVATTFPGVHGLNSVRILAGDTAVAVYGSWIVEQPRLMLALDELRGRDLACWCRLDTEWCHAEVLGALSNDDWTPTPNPQGGTA